MRHHLDRILRTMAIAAILLGLAGRCHAEQILTLSQTSHPLVFFMESSTTPGTGVASLSPTVTISKDGGAFASPSGAVTEVGGAGNGAGWYKVAGNATDEGTDGVLVLRATGAGCFEAHARFLVVDMNVYDAVRGGLAALPNANAEAAGGLYTRGSGAGQINQPANGQIDSNTVKVDGAALGTHASGMFPADVRDLLGTAWLTPGTAGTPDVNVKLINAVSTSPVTTIKAVLGLTTADTIATYTGNTPQSGDGFATLTNGTYGLAQLVRSATPANALAVDLSGRVDLGKWTGLAISAPNGGAIKVDVEQIATVNVASAAAGYMPSDAIKWTGGTIPAPATAGVPTSDAKYLNGTLQTARDLGGTLGVAGAGLTALGDTRIAHLDADVSSRSTLGGTAQTGDSYARLGAPAGASIAADIAGVPTATWAATCDGSLTFLQSMRAMLATTTGKTLGAGTTDIKFYAPNGSTLRVEATVDQTSGERSAVTVTP